MMRVGLWNVGRTPSLDDMRQAIDGLDVLGCNEGGDQGPLFRDLLETTPGLRMYRPPGGPGRLPIFYRDTLPVLDRAHAVMVPARRIVPEGVRHKGAGGPVIGKHLTRLTIGLEDTLCHIVVTHLIASATRHDLARGERQRRRQHYQDHIAALLRYVNDLEGDVILAGDLNACPDRDQDLLWPLLDRFTGWTTTPTHRSGRAIDHVLVRDAPPGQTRRISGDHRRVSRHI